MLSKPLFIMQWGFINKFSKYLIQFLYLLFLVRFLTCTSYLDIKDKNVYLIFTINNYEQFCTYNIFVLFGCKYLKKQIDTTCSKVEVLYTTPRNVYAFLDKLNLPTWASSWIGCSKFVPFKIVSIQKCCSFFMNYTIR